MSDSGDSASDALRELAARLQESGHDPDVVYVHAAVAAQIQAAAARAERRARHWYWRLWGRVTGTVRLLVDRYNAWRDEDEDEDVVWDEEREP